MKLFYHGSSYEHNSSQVGSQKKEVTLNKAHQPQPTFSLKYRGATYLVDPNAESTKVPTPKTAHTLSYHGSTYLVNGSTQADVRGVFPELALVW